MEDFFDRRYLSEETVKEIGIGTAEGARSFAYSIRKDVLKGGRYLEIIRDSHLIHSI